MRIVCAIGAVIILLDVVVHSGINLHHISKTPFADLVVLLFAIIAVVFIALMLLCGNAPANAPITIKF